MATYKVLQDIEAEDKFVGPLTLRQFILAGIAAVSGYVSYLLFTSPAWFLGLFLIPVILFAGFLAWPWGRDQPTEIWLLAKIRFMLKPRRRIWDQSGMQELVTITAPKKVDNFVGDNLSQTEVKSRLRALADTIDSRGWAIKNSSVNYYSQPSAMANLQSDRLIDASAFSREVPNVDVHAADDILDEKNNPTALHLSKMVTSSENAHRQETLKNLKEIGRHEDGKTGNKDGRPDSWFMHSPDTSKLPKNQTAFAESPIVAPDSNDNSSLSTATVTQNDEKILKKSKAHTKHKFSPNGRLKTIDPSGTKVRHSRKIAKTRVNRGTGTSPETLKPAILNLANNNDLTVATIAHEANKKPPAQGAKSGDLSSDEVVIPLR